MKKFATLLILLVTAVTFTSCSDDDEPGSASNLIGTWESVSTIYWEKTNGQLTEGSEEEIAEEDIRLVFTEDGDCYHYLRDNRPNAQWQLDDHYTYKYSGGKLKLSTDDDVFTYNVKTLTETTLVTEIKLSESENGVKFEGYEKLTFRKVS